MKKLRIIAMLMALITVLSCLVSCGDITVDYGQKNDTETTADPYPNHITVSIVVYAATQKNAKTGNYEKLEEADFIPIIGAPKNENQNGLSVGYNNGETVSATTVLKQLSAKRKGSSLVFASSGNIQSITMNRVEYATDSAVNIERKETIKIDNVNTEVYYMDMILWEWKINDKVVNNIGDVEIKDGDSIVLNLILDNTTKGQNYITVEEYNAQFAVETTAPAEEE